MEKEWPLVNGNVRLQIGCPAHELGVFEKITRFVNKLNVLSLIHLILAMFFSPHPLWMRGTN